MTTEAPIPVDSKTRRLLTEFSAPLSKVEITKKKQLRQEAWGLLDQHGQPLFAYFKLDKVEEQIDKGMISSKVTDKFPRTLRLMVRPFNSFFETSAIRPWAEAKAHLDQLREYLLQSPLRMVDVPFGEHQLKVLSWHPERIEEISQALLHPQGVSNLRRFDRDDCYIVFTSTAWGEAARAITPDNASETELVKRGIFPGVNRGVKQIEAILAYTNNYLEQQIDDKSLQVAG